MIPFPRIVYTSRLRARVRVAGEAEWHDVDRLIPVPAGTSIEGAFALAIAELRTEYGYGFFVKDPRLVDTFVVVDTESCAIRRPVR